MEISQVDLQRVVKLVGETANDPKKVFDMFCKFVSTYPLLVLGLDGYTIETDGVSYHINLLMHDAIMKELDNDRIIEAIMYFRANYPDFGEGVPGLKHAKDVVETIRARYPKTPRLPI